MVNGLKNQVKISILALVSALVLGLQGCGVGVDANDDYTTQQQKQAKAQEERYSRIQGTYEGTITPVGREPLRARLILFIVQVRDTANPDGTVRVRPGLFGRLRLVDAVAETDYLTMGGEFYDDDGKLSLSSVASQNGQTSGANGGSASGDALQIGVLGTVLDSKASLNVTRRGGSWGHFDGTRVSTDAAAPTNGDADDYRTRLNALYSGVVGVYTGLVSGGPDRYCVQLNVTMGQIATSDGVTYPSLNAYYRRLDFPSGAGERSLQVVYESDTSVVTMQGVQGGGTVPGSNIFSGTGTWVAGRLSVDLSDQRGTIGHLDTMRNIVPKECQSSKRQ